MDARICTNPTCRTVQSAPECGLCKKPTKALSPISLAPIGLDGTARLTCTPGHTYSIIIDIPSGLATARVAISDLLQACQPQLPHVNEASGLMIMDALKSAGRLVRTKNTDYWAGWITYLLEVLQDYTNATSFDEVLASLHHQIHQMIDKNAPPPREE